MTNHGVRVRLMSGNGVLKVAMVSVSRHDFVYKIGASDTLTLVSADGAGRAKMNTKATAHTKRAEEVARAAVHARIAEHRARTEKASA